MLLLSIEDRRSEAVKWKRRGECTALHSFCSADNIRALDRCSTPLCSKDDIGDVQFVSLGARGFEQRRLFFLKRADRAVFAVTMRPQLWR